MIQGALCLNWSNRKLGIFPRIENSGLLGNSPPSPRRLQLWIDAGISIEGAPDHVFVKLHTHGTQEDVMNMLFDRGGLEALFESTEQYRDTVKFHFVSAREMVNVVRQLQEQ